ncbi:VOC family protein [Parashewanella curva]|uniref:VOC family protein n=1 Tax=Parashewanella curva TaxID=2338552 RepID=A0A3L8PZY2_9GAMM|nr:VOC family protein [Parashewanella curva]RLV61016.1 VOC family protein [Parashewanella curva]
MPAIPKKVKNILDEQWLIFSKKIQQLEKELSLSALSLECDHAAIRVNSTLLADQFRAFLELRGTVISENIINGRPILIFKLTQPLILNGKEVPCIELPYPNDKIYPEEGWEHVEFVVPSHAKSCDQLTEDVLSVIPQLAPHINGQTGVKVKLSSPCGEHERLANPTIALKKDNICIKLHPHSIQDIILSESSEI